MGAGAPAAAGGGRLIQGDARLAMAALLAAAARGRPGLRGEVDLICADLPFHDGRGVAPRAGRDRSAPGAPDPLARHLAAIVPRLCLMRELLANTGSIYVRPDARVAHYVKIVLDALFGRECCVNDIVWPTVAETSAGRHKRFARAHDTLFFYRKNKDVTLWNDPFQCAGCEVPAPAGPVAEEAAGRARTVRCRDVWSDIASGLRDEDDARGRRTDALLERILSASSTAGSLVADFSAGSGATAIVAERLGRRWIVCEADRTACADVRRRLVVGGARPFLCASVVRVHGAGDGAAAGSRRVPAERGIRAGGA